MIGRQLGVYRIDALLGAGGMGEVYRARDTKLKRDVAIKVLPQAVTADHERVARFRREAQALAALNHPHVGAIYGFEELDDVSFLVLELVDGPTLAERINKGPMAIADVLSIARQLADALDVAHQAGIIHRDLKPANVKLTAGGQVKVLDFGIAKVEPAAASGDTETLLRSTATEDGAIIGTPAYMSPEQARGLPIDKRTDIWAFGCVVYEMLTQREAFPGKTIADRLAAIIEREPDWSALPGATSPAARNLLERCLEKDPKRRLRDIGDAQRELDDLGSRTPSRQIQTSYKWQPALKAVSLIAAGSLITVAWYLARGRSESDVPSQITRTTITLRAGEQLDTQPAMMPLALSADGRRVAYVARRDGRSQLYVRDLGAFESKPLPGTEGARHPFFSPDGQSVAFSAGGKLKRVSMQSGSAVTICDAPTVAGAGTWSSHGTIVFDPGQSGLMKVSAAGGTPERVTSNDPEADSGNLSWPRFLPDGRNLLVSVGPGLILEGTGTVAILSLDTGEWTSIGPGAQAQYMASGHIVFHAPHVREGELQAVAFDLSRPTARREPVSVLSGVFRSEGGGGAYFATSSSGALIFAHGGHARSLVRVDRAGRRAPVTDDRRGFRFPVYSPNGRQIAVTIDPRPSEIWIYDVLRRSGVPLISGGHNLVPLWALDGTRVLYSSRGDIYSRAADGATPERRLLEMERGQYPEDWTRDGTLVFSDTHPLNRHDVWLLPPNGKPHAILPGPGHEPHARVSPDDRWIAYPSDESGSSEVLVRPFPNVNDKKWVVSVGGGVTPRWSRDGSELFYMNGTSMMAVAVDTRGGTFRASAPTFLFSGPFETGSPNFDVSPDGQSFLMVEADPDAKPTQVNVILNWTDELRRQVPTQ